MSVNVMWKIKKMNYNVSDGGVTTVYWSCEAIGTGEDGENSDCYCIENGKLSLIPNPESPEFIGYDSLTEDDVLTWVYNSLIEDDETSEDAKNNIEQRCISVVENKISEKNSKSSGMPWVVIEESEES